MTLEQDIQFALEHDEAIEYKQYENEILADIAIENIEFESVVLTNCKFMNCNFERVSFYHTQLNHCEYANCNFPKVISNMCNGLTAKETALILAKALL